jgi:hypothetical protein
MIRYQRRSISRRRPISLCVYQSVRAWVNGDKVSDALRTLIRLNAAPPFVSPR